MNTRKTSRMKSPVKTDSQPEPEFQMNLVQKIVFWSCVGVGIIAAWILQAVLGMKGIIATTVITGIGGGVAGLVGIGIVLLLMLTPDQKRKHSTFD